MPARGAVLGIGRLLRLEILDPKSGRVRIVTPKGKWLAWNVGKRTYCICRVLTRGRVDEEGLVGTGQKYPRLPAEIKKAHKRFHEAAARGALKVDVPTPSGKLVQRGLLKALVYDVPPTIRSPGKNTYHWHHAFGDTGHAGGDQYPLKVLPAVLKDAKGNWFIRRRPGNIFTVDTWLRG